MLGLTTALVLTLQATSPQAPQLPASLAPPDSPADSLVFSGRSGQLEVRIPRVEAPDVRVDGVLDEDVWRTATVLSDFTQYEPVEGLPSAQDTEVRVFYSSDAIYFGVRALDRDPELIVGRLAERDRSVFNDDWIRIMLDTFDDQRQAYVFYVNPLGIQTDGLWIEGLVSDFPVSIDFNPDFIWESDGRIDDEGWVAEIRIPYVSLRFREVAEQAWGIQIAREVKRFGYKQSWAPLTQDVSSTLAQSGRIVGLRDIESRRLIEVNPVVTGIRTGAIGSGGDFEREEPDSEFGLNARYGLTQNLVLDATYNPDFSQVEADVNQISVNERFLLFFPEQRPFFLEGTEVFRTPKNLVYTRQIADPIAGGKITGKVGSFNVGYLGAVDESPVSILGGEDDAVFNIVRMRRDVGSGSTFGALYTDRTLTNGDEYNRVLGADARILFGPRYTLTTQFAGSWTSSGPGTVDEPGFQPAVYAQFERSGRSFGFDVLFDDVDPAFETRTGFLPRLGNTQVRVAPRYTWYGSAGAALERVATNLVYDGYWDRGDFWDGGSAFESEVQFEPTLYFRGRRQIGIILRSGYFRFRRAAYANYVVEGPGGPEEFVLPDALENMLAFAVIPRIRIDNAMNLNGRLFYREIPIFSEAARGLELQVAPEFQLRPTDALQLTLAHTYSKIRRQDDKSTFSKVNLSRIRAQYQFGKSVFVRGIVQYDMQDRDALRDPTTGRPLLIGGSRVEAARSSRFDGQFLLSYEPSPGTVFFFGYSRLMRGDRLSYQLNTMDLTRDGLFVKLSYLFRL